MHDNCLRLFEKHIPPYLQSANRVLEIGPDFFPSSLELALGRDSLVWDTLDVYEEPRLTYPSAPEYSFPVPDNTYDVVLSGNVIEHVRKIWLWMSEVARVCKPVSSSPIILSAFPTTRPQTSPTAGESTQME